MHPSEPIVNSIQCSPPRPHQPTIFMDRDGIINIDEGYTHRIDQFGFVDGIIAACQRWQAAGYALVVITNQSGIDRGYYTDADFKTLTDWMVTEFSKKDVTIAAVYYCPHTPEFGCSCRKPNPGMLLHAIRLYQLEPTQCWMIGDKESDITAAINAGILNTIRIGNVSSPTKSKFKAGKISEIDPTELPKLSRPIQPGTN